MLVGYFNNHTFIELFVNDNPIDILCLGLPNHEIAPIIKLSAGIEICTIPYLLKHFKPAIVTAYRSPNGYINIFINKST